jgi:HD-GYP domain-containing protein (c-di-GMP phosphodiesterase class II)
MNHVLSEPAKDGNANSLDMMMPFAVRCLDGEELLSAGSRLDETVIVELARTGRQKKFETSCLLRHNNIMSDMECFASETPYTPIFGGADSVRAHLRQFGEIPIPTPLLIALDEFKQNDFYTYRHSLVVFALTSFLMEKCYPNSMAERNILLVGPTHDIGKLSISADILHKKTPLTRRERQFLEFHSVAGFVMLSYYLGDHHHPAAHVALNHHERRNGSGYPRGVAAVSALVEMVATCDIYDALISSRPYRNGVYDNRAALEELSELAEKGALGRYSIQALISRNRDGHPVPKEISISGERRGSTPESNCHSVIVDE